MVDIINWENASTIAADNLAVRGISDAEGWLPSTVNNFTRASWQVLAMFWDDYGGVVTVAGTADAITVTTSGTHTALSTGLRVLFKAGADNTTAVTLNLDAIGAKAVRKMVGATDVALVAGDIKSGRRYDIVYDAAANAAAGAWILLNGINLVFPATISPNASDGAALGTSALMWSDLFLASGAVVNFNNGNVAVTHSAGLLTSTGNIHIDKSGDASLVLDKGASGNQNLFYGYTAGVSRWGLVFGNDTAESGSNVGSDLTFNRHNDAGTYIDSPLTIIRSTGEIVISAGQVRFPATANPSTNPNALDDYQEQTFTPGLTVGGSATGVTFGAQIGRGTKIGDRFKGSIQMTLSSNGSGSGAVLVTGLPYTASGSINQAVTICANSGCSGLTAGLCGYVNAGATTIQIKMPNTTGSANATETNITDSADFYITFDYEVA
jgi:hypothetical protein